MTPILPRPDPRNDDRGFHDATPGAIAMNDQAKADDVQALRDSKLYVLCCMDDNRQVRYSVVATKMDSPEPLVNLLAYTADQATESWLKAMAQLAAEGGLS